MTFSKCHLVGVCAVLAHGAAALAQSPCTTLQSCADLNNTFIRDDNCLWWICIIPPPQGACAATSILFGDMGGAFGNCFPDGTVDGNDVFHALNCFSNTSITGGGTYPCETTAPLAFNVDAGGAFGACCPDGVCDINDAFHAIFAFSGANTCTCPLNNGIHSCGFITGPQPQVAPEVVGTIDVELEASTHRLKPGGEVEVDIFLNTPVDDLRGYQLHLGIAGGTAGALELVEWTIRPRRDHVFGGQHTLEAFNLDSRQMLAGLEGDGVSAPGGYLATATLRATKGTTGSFVVDLLFDDVDGEYRTFFLPTHAGRKVEVAQTVPAVIHVGREAPRRR